MRVAVIRPDVITRTAIKELPIVKTGKKSYISNDMYPEPWYSIEVDAECVEGGVLPDTDKYIRIPIRRNKKVALNKTGDEMTILTTGNGSDSKILLLVSMPSIRSLLNFDIDPSSIFVTPAQCVSGKILLHGVANKHEISCPAVLLDKREPLTLRWDITIKEESEDVHAMILLYSLKQAKNDEYYMEILYGNR